MRRFLTALMVTIASLGLALGSASALAQKAETPKDARAETKKADTKKAYAKKSDAKSGTAAGGSTAGALIDINTATEKELASLPGIGDARATAIVKNRPYKGKNELKDRKIIPESVYNGIQDKIIARQDGAAAKKDAAPAPKKDEKKK
jgi:DNA uptake protein ComE-like DNA-binding protein